MGYSILMRLRRLDTFSLSVYMGFERKAFHKLINSFLQKSVEVCRIADLKFLYRCNIPSLIIS